MSACRHSADKDTCIECGDNYVSPVYGYGGSSNDGGNGISFPVENRNKVAHHLMEDWQKGNLNLIGQWMHVETWDIDGCEWVFNHVCPIQWKAGAYRVIRKKPELEDAEDIKSLIAKLEYKLQNVEYRWKRKMSKMIDRNKQLRAYVKTLIAKRRGNIKQFEKEVDERDNELNHLLGGIDL